MTQSCDRRRDFTTVLLTACTLAAALLAAWPWRQVRAADAAPAAAAAAAAAPAAAAVPADALAQILGAPDEAWTLANAPAPERNSHGEIVLAPPGPSVCLITSKQPVQDSSQYVATLRMPMAAAPTAYALLDMAQKTGSDGKPTHVQFSISGNPANPYVSYATTIIPGEPATQYGTLYVSAVNERSLAWPQWMRATMEAQMAQTLPVQQMVLELRCTISRGELRTYLNGRLATASKLPPGLGAGVFTLQVAPGTELLSLRVSQAPAVEDRFEPVPISGHVNAQALAGGAMVQQASLAAAADSSGVAQCDGVPFLFTAPDQRGQDHIDVGRSWAPFTSQQGWFAAHLGQFGGRWTSADRIDPARICLYVPPGRYRKLHLLAVASEEPDTLPLVSAQFYRPNAGHPEQFATRVPGPRGGSDRAIGSVPVTLSNGKKARLYHAEIELDPDVFANLSDLQKIGMEITKQVHYYRGYPDPLEYSYHGGGLPSGVQIYAMTLERAAVDVDVEPGAIAHVWTAPKPVDYTLVLRNRSGQATTAKLTVQSVSDDGVETTKQELEVQLPAGDEPVRQPLTLALTRYGMHRLRVTCQAGGQSFTAKRQFAWLHPDTREKGNWVEGRGALYGFWPWGGGHDTPGQIEELTVMGAAGAETSCANYEMAKPEVKALAQKLQMLSTAAFEGTSMYFVAFPEGFTWTPQWNPKNPQAMEKELLEKMKAVACPPSAVSRPTWVAFFPEPLVGWITTGVLPTHYGEPEYQLPAGDQKTLKDMLEKFLFSARLVKKHWPDLKLLFPHGDPMNTYMFLHYSEEARALIDGVALDLPGFERTPEQQINQVVLSRMVPILQDLKRYKKKPYLVLIEGFCVGSRDIDTGEVGQAEIGTRDFLQLLGVGVDQFTSANAPFDCANYWGENHYGAGWCTRLPLPMPKLAFVNYATLTRHLNRCNFVRYLPIGSTSAYCQQFQHYKNGKNVYALWTVRGTRPVTINVPAGAQVAVYDGNDNQLPLTPVEGGLQFTIGTIPCYLEGHSGELQPVLGESDHSDAYPRAGAEKLGNLGDGRWSLTSERDAQYENNSPLQIVRFPGQFAAKTATAPKGQGSRAMAVHLPKQDKDRGVMPFYSSLIPKAPITIPGKASHLGLWVRAASDWGRVVYCLRDARGERWLSVGSKEQWNCDDIHTWSAFCFDGWRYLRFELPSNLPWDCFREYGSSWWGSHGGDNIVDLPLQLEKVIVERRPQVIYGNELVPASSDDVLLADLYSEYARPEDKSEKTVVQSRLRMPSPKTTPELENPIAELARTATGAPGKLLGVRDPDREYDGTRCLVDFAPVAGAKSYDIWVSPYRDGRGAMLLGGGWKASGGLIQGLRPETPFYAFLVYTDAAGKLSKPSAPLEFTLKDRFVYK